MPRKNEQEWAIIENEYITMPVTLNDLHIKYKLSVNALSLNAIKRKWEVKRNEYLENICKRVQNQQSEAKAKEDYNLIEDIREIIKLKSQAERKLLLQALKEGKDIKILGYSLNKSKDSIYDLARLEQLLLGNPTDRLEFKEQEKEKEARAKRMELLGFN